MKIIGLGHYSRTGKDSLANYLLNELVGQGLTAKKIPFAWKLKDICEQLYGWDGLKGAAYYDTKEGEQFRDVKLPTIGKTPVEIWVAMGTPAVRENVYQKTWIDYVLRTDHGVDVVIIPDVRFPNEVQAIRDLSGWLVKVVRPGYGPKDTVADKALLEFTGWDIVAGASGAMSELEDWAVKIARAIAFGQECPPQDNFLRKAALAVEKA